MSHSIEYDKNKIRALVDIVGEHLEPLLDYFNIEYRQSNKIIYCSCPIHGGDSDRAFNIYYQGGEYPIHYKCRSHNCHEVFGHLLFNMVRGMLSRAKYKWCIEGDREATFMETLNFLLDFTKQDYQKLNGQYINLDKNLFNYNVNILNRKRAELPPQAITREKIRKSLRIPSQYFLDRGFSSEILDKYDIGDSFNHKKTMYKRAVVPIYDDKYLQMVGCTGRSIYEECSKCKGFHKEGTECHPEYTKWRHSLGFRGEDFLYNLWFAKSEILKTNSVILVESPGNVWKLEEAEIHNSLGIFGTSLTKNQLNLLNCTGALNIVLILDNDKAGKDAVDTLYKQLKNTYNVYYIDLDFHEELKDFNDLGDIPITLVKQIIKPCCEAGNYGKDCSILRKKTER